MFLRRPKGERDSLDVMVALRAITKHGDRDDLPSPDAIEKDFSVFTTPGGQDDPWVKDALTVKDAVVEARKAIATRDKKR